MKNYESSTLISFRQISKTDLPRLTESQLIQLSELIYNTDPFIYPAMFESKEHALLLLSELIKSDKDSMFTVDNFFVAMDSDHNIVGLILWYKGGMIWDSGPLRSLALDHSILLPQTFDIVCQEYFSEYSEVSSEDIIQIINVCVSEKHRGKGIGQSMLKSFCSIHSDSTMELYTLADNPVAVQCYTMNGFRVVKACDGFAIGSDKPRCLKMVKTPK